tara:strand:- start:3188 stop:5557 length:2370 start_codon:yes stop_codon:yes gene_type:complete
MENNSLTDIVKSRRESGEGITSSLGGALKEKAKEKLDWKRALPQGGLLTALFPKLTAYKAQKANSPTSKVVKLISSNLASVAKSSIKIKSIAKNISGMKKEVNKFAKLENVTPATMPETERDSGTTPSFMSKAVDFVKSNSTAILIGLAIAGVGIALTLGFDKIKSTISDAFDSFANFGLDMFDKLRDSITGAFDGIKKSGGEIYDNMKESITGVYDGLKDFGNIAYDKMKESVNSISNNVTKAKDDVLSLIKGNKAEESVTTPPTAPETAPPKTEPPKTEPPKRPPTASERRAANRQSNNATVKGIESETSSAKPEIFNPNNETSSTSATDTSEPSAEGDTGTTPSKNGPNFGPETGGGAVTSMQRGTSNVNPESLGGRATSATPTMAGGAISDEASTQLAQKIGLSNDQWEIYRNTIASIESGGKYDISGGAGNHYDGRYQLGRDAKIDASRIAGVPNPGHDDKGRESFRKDPKLQELLFAAFTVANDGYLKNLSKTYKEADVAKRMEILAYAHNQGAGGAAKWLESGVAGKDAFGTAGTKYSTAIASNLKGGTLPATNSAQNTSTSPNKIENASTEFPTWSKSMQSYGEMKKVDGAVIHHTGGGSMSGAIETLKQRGLSYHYIIDKDGTVKQLIPGKGIGYHAESYNVNTFGIALVAEDDSKVTAAQISASISLNARLASTYNYDSKNVFGHGEISKNKMPSEGKAVVDSIRAGLTPTVTGAVKDVPGAPATAGLKGQQRQAATAAQQPNSPQQNNNQNNPQTAAVYNKNVAQILLASLLNSSGYG